MAWSSFSERRLELEAEDYLVLTAAALLPWAFGGVELWAHRTAALLLVLSACVALWKHGPPGWSLHRKGSWWLLPAALLAVWGTIQIVPLPPAAIAALSPEAHRIYEEAIPGYPAPSPRDTLTLFEEDALARIPEADGVALPPDDWFGFGRDLVPAFGRNRTLLAPPRSSRERLFWYVALLLGFLVVRRRGADRETYRAYSIVLLTSLSLMAVFALLQWQTWNGRLYWVRTVPFSETNSFGPYINPIHYAGIMELAVLWLAGYTLELGRRAIRMRKVGYSTILAAATLVCLISVVAAASKASVVLIGGGLAVLGLLAARRTRTRLYVLGGLVVLAALGAVAVWNSELSVRFESYFVSAEQLGVVGHRQVAWIAAVRMWQAFPITGSGIGAFGEVFSRYLPAGENKYWNQAHNDYLEVLLGLGLVGAILVAWLAIGFGRRAVGRVSRHIRAGSTSRLGLVIGILCLSAHALVDFNHQIPANALMFVICCALADPDLDGDGGDR